MPKPTSSKPSTSVQGYVGGRPSELPAGSAVTVSPSFTPVIPSTNSTLQLADALKDFEPGLRQYVEDQAALKRQEDVQKGAADRMAQGELSNDQARSNLTTEQTASYQAGYMRMQGELSARRRSRELEQSYLSGDRDTVDVNKLVDNAVSEDTKGLNDADYLAGYLPEMNRFSAALKDTHAKYQAAQLRAKTESGMTERMMGRLDDLIKNPKATAQDFYASLNTDKKEGKDVFGFDYAHLSDLALNAYSSAAIRAGRPDVLDVFKQKNPDGTPGLYYNPKYTDAIDKAQRQAEHVQKEQQAKIDEEQQYNLYKQIDTEVNNGTFSDKRYTKFLQGDRPLLTAEKLLAFKAQADAVAAYKKSVSDATDAVRAADSSALALQQAVDPNFKKARDDAIDTMVAEAAQAGPDAVDRAYKLLSQTRQEIPHLKNLFAIASPTNPETFTNAVNAYESLKKHDAAWAAQHVSDAQALQFDFYYNQVLAGASPQAALQAVREVGTGPQLRDVSARFRGDWARELKSTAMSDAGSWKNSDYVANWIEQTAETRLALGGTDSQGAVNYAVDLFKARHQNVGGHAVYNGGTTLSEADVRALDWFVMHTNQTLAAQDGPYVDKKNGVWLEAAPMQHGVYFVRYEKTGQAFDTVTLDEVRNQFTGHNYDALVKKWKERQKPITQKFGAQRSGVFGFN